MWRLQVVWQLEDEKGVLQLQPTKQVLDPAGQDELVLQVALDGKKQVSKRDPI
jgi:hypothetical protein